MKVAVIATSQGRGNTFVSTNLSAVSGWAYLDLNSPCYGYDKLNTEEGESKQLLWHSKKTISSCNDCEACVNACVKNCFIKSETGATLFCKGCAEGECTLSCDKDAVKSNTEEVGSLQLSKKDNFQIATVKAFSNLECEATECAINLLKDTNLIIDCADFEKNHTLTALKSCDYCVIVTEGDVIDFEVFKCIIRTCKLMGKPYGVVINKLTTPYDKLVDYCNLHSTDILAKIPYNKRDERAILAGELIAKQKFTYKQHFNGAITVIKKKLKKSQ